MVLVFFFTIRAFLQNEKSLPNGLCHRKQAPHVTKKLFLVLLTASQR